ncbi:MAG: hypothetical protein ACYTGB_14360, partial [Planctomycetota bacterium]
MQVECPRCNQQAAFPDSLAGSEARCPSCGGLIPLPTAAEGAPENEPQPVGQLPEDAAEDKPSSSSGDSGSVFARLDGAGVTDSEVLDPSRVPTEPARGLPLWMKFGIVLVPLLLVLAVVGTVLGLHLERKAYARRTAESFDAAKQAYQAADLEKADRAFGESLKMLKARPDAVPEQWAATLKKEAERLRSHIGLWREARKAAAGMSIEPAATRRRLEDLLKQVAVLGPEAEPVARLVEGLREQAFEQDLSDRRKGLEKHLSGILAQVDEAKFGSARDALKLARETIAKAPADMKAKLGEAFEPRFKELDAVFAFYAETEKLVKAAPAGGPKRTAEAARIAARKSSPATAGVGAKGLALQFEKWEKELATDRRPLPKPASGSNLVLTDIAREFAAAAPGLKLDEDSIDGHRALFRLTSAKHTYRVQRCDLGGRVYFMIEIDGVRLVYPAPADNRLRKAIIRYEMAQAPIVAAALRNSGHEMAWSATPWHVFLTGPLQGAEPTAVLRGKGLICTAGRIWKVSGRPTEDQLRRAGGEFVRTARDLEEAILGDRRAGKELREMLALMVKAAYQPRQSATDFLPRQFCSEAVARGYIEKNAPDLARRLEARLAAYRGAYRNLVRFVPGLSGKSGDDEIEWGLNADGRALWRIYDSKADTTTFALRHNDEQFRNQFYVHTVFAGKHPSWPLTAPKEVRMVHHAVGRTASWDPETDKLTVDRERWRLATEVEELRRPPAHFGRPDWRMPPHVLITDSMGSALGLVTPQGRLDMPEFGTRSGAELRKSQDAFLNKCAHRLRSAGELHLFFRYFAKYTFDSPLTEYPFLIGDKENTGDVHQDAYQTLDRKIGGRFIADCDDLAELYQAITRRQGRLSFVLGQPSHAICGFVEREKGKGDYVFTALDTGPPRQFRAAKLDTVVESAFATFDEEHTEAFDPNSVCFLLRFAGEQTRTPYFLGTRMFLDPEYAKTMIRVQRDWHFAYICSGRDTMVEMVKREKDAPTLFELAAFYRETSEWPLAIEWCKKGIAALQADDVMGRLTENVRLATYLERSGDKEAARKVVLDAVAMVAKEEAVPGARAERFVGLRFSLASDLKSLDRPFEAWKTAAPAARLLARKRLLAGDNLTRLAIILQGMRDAERSGKKLDEK